MRRHLTKAIHIATCVAFALPCLARCASADQVGIDKVRLFEEQAGQYVLEVDTFPRFVAAYREPVLPERFEMSEIQRERQAGFLVLRYRFRSLGTPLDGDDEILLPWGRAGASITVQWIDGSVHQNLFLRDFEGINVPIRLLKPSQISVVELARDNLLRGFSHGGLGWNHWLLVAAVGLLASGWWRMGLILLFAAGHAISLVFADIGALVVPGEAAEICVAVVALLIARAAPLDAERCRRFAAVMVIMGVLHGLANAKMLRQAGVLESEIVQALFMFNLGVDTVQVTAVTIVSACAIVLSRLRSPNSAWMVRAGVGGCAVGVLLIALTGGDIAPEGEVASQQNSSQFELPGTQMVSPGMGNRPQPPRALRQPVAGFLTIEPFETRLEVLVRLDHARPWIDLPAEDGTINVDQQERTKQQLIDLIAKRTAVRIDGKEASPSVLRADFVTVESNGILSRPSPVPEPVDDAVLGVTFIYDTAVMPESAQLDWSLFSAELQRVSATTTDPFGGKKQDLSPDNSQLTWKNRWSGYRPPEIKPVAVTRLRLPALSMILAIGAGAVYWFFARSGGKRLMATLVVILFTFSSLAYPFVRISVAAPFAPTWKPSTEQTADILDRLLTNVYRAYDMRDEEAIYDRLALTITGEQLTEIYLDTRRSLELENRGGARAKVDDVEILDVHSVASADDGGFAVELSWTVSGSVTHFGHTHYRRNRYRAVVVIVPAGGHWKIQSIEVGEQQREL